MIVFTADLHLSPTTWAALPDLRGDAYNSLQQIRDYCLQKKASALILGGDIYDKRNPDSLSVAVLESCLKQLQEEGIQVYAIQGQHDRSDPPWTQIHGSLGVIQLAPTPVEIKLGKKTVTIAGFDNTSAAWVQENLKSIDADIVVMHQALKGVMGFAEKWDVDEKWLHDNVKLALIGDIHLPVSVGRCHYPGSTNMRAIDEPIDKSFITISDNLKTVERVKLVTRGVIDMAVADDDGLEEALAFIRGYKTENALYSCSLFYVKIAPNVKKAYDALSTACAEAGHFFMPATMKVTVEGEATEQREVSATSLDSCLAQAVNPEEDADLYGFTLRLLKSEQPADELVAVKKELGV